MPRAARPTAGGDDVHDGSDVRGSATIVMVAVVAVTMLLATALLAAAGTRVSAARAQGAADAAALAGAAAVVGLLPDDPCALAERTARANAARVASCSTAGAVVRVEVRLRRGPFDVDASAVAGPTTVRP